MLWRWRTASKAGRDVAMPPVDTVLLLLLLLAPVVNPWYALWALGPAMAARRALVPVMGCVGVLAYLNGSVLREAGWQAATASFMPYSVAWPIALIEVTAVGVAAVCIQRLKSSKNAMGSPDRPH